jgi:hypothetical protein
MHPGLAFPGSLSTSFLLPAYQRRTIGGLTLARHYSRSRPPQPEKRLSPTIFFPKREPSVSPVAAGTGRYESGPWAKARLKRLIGRSR